MLDDARFTSEAEKFSQLEFENENFTENSLHTSDRKLLLKSDGMVAVAK